MRRIPKLNVTPCTVERAMGKAECYTCETPLPPGTPAFARYTGQRPQSIFLMCVPCVGARGERRPA